MAAPVYEESNTGVANTNVQTVSVSRPGTQGECDGAILLLGLATDGNETHTPPSDSVSWVEIYSEQSTEAALTISLWWKVGGASEPATYAPTWTTNETATVFAARISGGNTSAIHKENIKHVEEWPCTVSLTPTIDDNLIVRFQTYNGGNRSWTTGAGHTEAEDWEAGTTSAGNSSTVFWMAQATAAANDVGAYPGAFNENSQIAISISPAVAASGHGKLLSNERNRLIA